MNSKKEDKISINTNNKTNNVTNSISSSITTDLLNNIDLNQLNLKTEEKNIPNTLGQKNLISTNVNNNKMPEKNPLNRLSMPSTREKRLATESIDYEPVFK